MALPTHVLMMYGYLLLFAWVFVEQIGVPLPATPVLLAAGALSVDGPIRFPLALLAAVVAALSADCTWFLIGRKHGHHVLRILCKLSIEPTTCVRRTQDSFGRRRGVMLMFAKFVPGLGMLAPPVAGQNGMEFGPFLFFDAIGVTLWVSVLLTAGRLFGDLLNRNPSVLELGRPVLGRAAAAWHCGLFRGARPPPPRDIESAGCVTARAGGTDAPARSGRGGLHRGPAPSAGAACPIRIRCRAQCTFRPRL